MAGVDGPFDVAAAALCLCRQGLELKQGIRMCGVDGAPPAAVLGPRRGRLLAVLARTGNANKPAFPQPLPAKAVAMNPPENTEPSCQQPPSPASWRHFEHRADIGVEGVGGSAAEAFAQAALALTAVVCDPAAVQPKIALEIACEAPDLELLLADWLNAVIYRMATERMLFSRFDVRIEGTRLYASMRGEPIDRQRHQPAVEVKGATYTALSVTRDADGRWSARCVVDV